MRMFVHTHGVIGCMSCLRTVQSEKSGETGCIKLKFGETVICAGTQSCQVAKAVPLRWVPRGAGVGWDLRPGEVGPWEPSPRTQESRLWAQCAPCLTLWAPACLVLLGSSALQGPGSLPPGPEPGPPGRQCPSRDSDSELCGDSNYLPASPLAGHLCKCQLSLPSLPLPTSPQLLPSLAAAGRQKPCQRGASEAELHLLGGSGLREVC